MKPGIHSGLDENEYHADPAISYSGLKTLLDCPARYAWEREHGRPEKAAFDFGHAAHAKVLGTGLDIVVVDAKDWRTKAAQEQRDEAYAAGKVPILVADAARVDALAEAVLADAAARVVLELEGVAEQSMGWARHAPERDDHDPVQLRGRIDVAAAWPNGTPVLADLKSTASADPRVFARRVADYRYHLQRAVYCDGWFRVTGEAPDFLFIAVEKDPPHFVTVHRLDWDAAEAGERLYAQALATYADCVSTDTWPGYSDDINELSLPRWAA